MKRATITALTILFVIHIVTCEGKQSTAPAQTVMTRDSFPDDESYVDYLAKNEIQKKVSNPDTSIFANKDDPDFNIKFENNEYTINSWFISMNKNGDMIKCEYFAVIEKGNWSVYAGIGRVLDNNFYNY